MKTKILFILMILFLVLGCEIKKDGEEKYFTAGYIISFDENNNITFYGLENEWKENGGKFYIPSKICEKNVTKLKYSYKSWEGCSEIYIPSTVTFIEDNTFSSASDLKKIYWNVSSVASTSFLRSGVELYIKSNSGEYTRYSNTGGSGGTSTGTTGGSTNTNGTIVKTSDGTYRFTQSSDGYWTSNNVGVHNSTATSTWSLTVSPSTTLSLYYDVSSESGYDKFTLSIDNTNVVTNVSGTVTNTVTRTLTSGTHSITATYSKDNSQSSGSDRVRVKFSVITGMKFVSGGTFSMGDSSDSYAIPVHSVTLASFYMCDHEVTQAEFREIMGTNPSYCSSSPASGEVQGNRPVEKVSWYAAIAYCNKRSLAEGKTPCYSVSGVTDWASLSYSSIPTSSNSNWNNATCNWSANGYRLPTEAEWEYAARGGTYNSSYTYSGSNTIGNVAWYSDNSSSKTHEVKKKTANALGLYDMSGNVYEWCWDWYGSYSSGSQSNPRGASSGSYRVVRGGGWYYNASDCRVASRSNGMPDGGYDLLGFRVVRSAN